MRRFFRTDTGLFHVFGDPYLVKPNLSLAYYRTGTVHPFGGQASAGNNSIGPWLCVAGLSTGLPLSRMRGFRPLVYANGLPVGQAHLSCIRQGTFRAGTSV